jgi:2-polyprenyl-3-methyl-5-hydroxy-6-metoxy-1,4-benzoquinol methylase
LVKYLAVDNYIEINKKSWNSRVDTHVASEFYDMENFLKGKNSLKSIELDLLGDLRGKKVLHLQCHFGQDSISMARMGAEVVGVDLSDKAVEKATEIAKKLNANARFIQADIYDLKNHLNEEFDIVFTSYGTIGWLPDMNRWAEIVSHFLKPAGQFVFVEFHPVVWMFDDAFEKVAYNYFNVEAIVENETGTYADRTANIEQSYIMWNHDLAEVLTALIANRLEIEKFQEFDYSPYNCFQETEKVEEDKYVIKHLGNRIPMVYALSAFIKQTVMF